ncbi:hypothetical protein [Pseudalkalibacillus berkeleyi]|uniref:Uncharacterized protein n=1 Tax=Pseudalkalibacillus berkeleyi TaxID=1069813 RepID=A0ABS9H6F5_9BACL|nr:hypothetical protein [Pseudalkalibacillus berkeleyi]MCF6139560.1 hypothetical protein [Pseudalkalibacillus berkeleyi]
MMESTKKRQTILLVMVALFAFLLPVSEVSANIGNFDYEDNGLTSTESDGKKDDGDKDGLLGKLEDLLNGAKGLFGKAKDFFQPAVDAVGDAFDLIKDKVSEGLDWMKNKFSEGWNWAKGMLSDGWAFAKNAWEGFTEWAGDVWAATPDWVKSTISFLGVSAAVVGTAIAGVISAPVAAVAVAGAGIAGGLYYLLNGGSEAYSFLGSLGWTAGGAIIGGVGQAIGAVSAGLSSLRVFAGRQLATMRLGYFLNRFATGSGIRAGLQVAKGLGGAWMKVGGPASLITAFSHLVNLGFTGDINGGEMVVDTGIALITAPLGFGLTKSFWSSAKTFQGLASPIFGSATLGGVSNVAIQAFKGDATGTDFLVGSAVGLTFVIPDAVVTKFVNNTSAEYTYEYIKKQIGDIFTDSSDKKVNASKNK